MFFSSVNRSLFPYICSLLLFVLTAIYITYPLVFHLGNKATNTQDELLISFIQVSVMRNILQHPLDLFESNIFYPYKNTLAYSDTHVISAVLSAIPVRVTGQPIAAINFTLIVSLFLLGMSAFMLTFSISRDFFSSILSGLLIQFSPATLDKNVHVQILAIAWVLLSVYFYLSFLKKRRFHYFIIALFFFVIQTWNSFLPGYFIVFSFMILTSFFLWKKKKKINYFLQRKHVIAVGVALLSIVPFIIPYYVISKEFSYVRDIRESIHLSLQPEDLYYPNNLTRLEPLLNALTRPLTYPKNVEVKVGYLGAVFSLLSLTTIIFCVGRRKKLPIELAAFVSIAITGLILSFGPVLHFDRRTIHLPFVIPLPYALFYYIIPGFQGIRAVYRWEMLFVLFMAISSSIVVSTLLTKLSYRTRLFIYLILIFSIIIEYRPMHFVDVVQVGSFPPVYQFLQKLPSGAAIVEMPIYNWNMAPHATIELKRVYYSSVHNKKILNGASGFSPPPWQKIVSRLLQVFPFQESIGTLKKLGINYIVVHRREYDVLFAKEFRVGNTRVKNGDVIIRSLEKNKSVEEVDRFGDDYVFKIK